MRGEHLLPLQPVRMGREVPGRDGCDLLPGFSVGPIVAARDGDLVGRRRPPSVLRRTGVASSGPLSDLA